jgi:hypothetical protein
MPVSFEASMVTEAISCASMELYSNISETVSASSIRMEAHTLTGDAIYTWCFKIRATLNGPEETGDLP